MAFLKLTTFSDKIILVNMSLVTDIRGMHPRGSLLKFNITAHESVVSLEVQESLGEIQDLLGVINESNTSKT